MKIACLPLLASLLTLLILLLNQLMFPQTSMNREQKQPQDRNNVRNSHFNRHKKLKTRTLSELIR